MGFKPVREIQEAEGSELVAAQEKDAHIEEIRRTIQEMQEIETWQAEVEHLSKCVPNYLNLHQESHLWHLIFCTKGLDLWLRCSLWPLQLALSRFNLQLKSWLWTCSTCTLSLTSWHFARDQRKSMVLKPSRRGMHI